MFDALAARGVAAELQARIGSGRVQAVFPLDPLSVALEVYANHQRHYLFASADPKDARVHLVGDKLRNSGEAPSSFVLLLKKHAVGAIINRVQALPRERVLQIDLEQAEEGPARLMIEVMGRHSNLILVDDAGLILDAVKRVTPAMSRARSVLPRARYFPPPPQDKLDPVELTAEELTRILAKLSDDSLWQTLVRTVAGTSPLLARELSFRVAGRVDAPPEESTARGLHALLHQIWQAPAAPTLALEEGQPVDVAAFALTHLPETQAFDSISAALEQYFGAVESYAAVKVPLRVQIEAARDRLERKRLSLAREIADPAEMERLRISGELILAHASDISPGQRSLRAEMVEGEPLDIALDPRRKPAENAQKYFAEYRRAKDAAATVPSRLRAAERDVEFADQVLDDLEQAQDRSEIDAVIAEASEAGLTGGNKRARREGANPPSGPRALVSPDGFTVLAGRNARQNEQVTFERASGEDLWLHTRQSPGAHVVILAGGREVPESEIEFAAGVAAYYSQRREEAWVDVIVSPRRNVRRVTGPAAHPGLVTVRGERVVRVRPWTPEE